MEKTTNIRSVIDKVKRHPMMEDIPFETAVEYIIEFIQLMGTPALYEEKTAIVKIENYRGALPCDYESMIQVRSVSSHKDGLLLPCVYTYSGNSFHMSPNKVPSEYSNERTYKIQGMAIYTSTKNTELEIAYRAFAVDEEGYPLIPDSASFRRGIERYIKLQWFEILFDEGKISAQVMARADQEYCWAAGDAQSEFSRLSIDKAQTLFNSFKTMLPRNNQHALGFISNGAQEIRKF